MWHKRVAAVANMPFGVVSVFAVVASVFVLVCVSLGSFMRRDPAFFVGKDLENLVRHVVIILLTSSVG